MKRIRCHSKAYIFFVLAISLLSRINCTQKSSSPTKVVCTTSMLGTIVRTIGQDKIKAVTIVPAAMCPGHFDIKPGDLKALTSAKVILNHGWEKWMDDLMGSVKNKELLKKTIKIEGSWMVPDVHIQGINEVARVLCEIDSKNNEFYKHAANKYIESVKDETGKIEQLMQNRKGIKIICSDKQTPFLKWLGYMVIAEYGRPEEMTPKAIMGIIRKAKHENVQLVVDNLQSGGETGKQIAEEIGVPWIALTNFPLKDSYIGSLKDNINKINRVLHGK